MLRNALASTALLWAALFAAPWALAQEAGKETPKPATELEKKSDADLEKDFTKLAKDVSRGMAQLESEIAKASLPARKADELKAEFESTVAKLKSGEAKEIHPGLKAWFKENPAQLAALLGTSEDEAKKLLEDDAALLKALGTHAEGVQKLVDDAATVESVLRKQLQIELAVKADLDKQSKLAKETEQNIDEILAIAYEMRARKPPWGGGSNPESSPEQQKQGQAAAGSKGSNTPGAKGAEDGYVPPPGGKPAEDSGNVEHKADKDAWDASKARKEQEDANSASKSDAAPSRYSGMKSKFAKNVTDPKAAGTPAPAAKPAATADKPAAPANAG